MSHRNLFPCNNFRQLHRRRFLEVGSLGTAGLGLTQLLAGQSFANSDDQPPGFGKAKRAILLFMWGGPSHLDTWDPKPNAPAEIRGQFQTITTQTTDLRISELLPNLAKHTNKLAIVRSMSHTDPAHLSSVHHLTTGHLAPRVNSDADPPSRKDSPHIGSLLSKIRLTNSVMPGCVMMPWMVYHPAAPGGTAPGQHGGWLGPSYDPFLIQGDPNAENFQVSGLGLEQGVSPQRFDERRRLSQLLEAQEHLGAETTAVRNYSSLQARAYDMLSSSAVQAAFDVKKESDATRQHYGRNLHGQCLLLSRRLLEAGVPLLAVNWHNDHAAFWDTHGDNFNSLKNRLCPPADQGFAALLEDLEQRGMLDDTLIVWVGEFGRRPHISAGNAGREHWPWCYSAVLAGAGIQGGRTYGRSDNIGAYPAENPVKPADLTATMYHALGIPSDIELRNAENRPIRLVDGEALLPLFTG